MSTTIQAVAGQQQATVRPKRPAFDEVWKHYRTVNIPAPDVYALVGGNAHELYKSNPKGYANACALRMSRAFNYGGLVITSKATGYKVKGGDGKNYLLRVRDMIAFVKANFGNAEKTVLPAGTDKTSDFSGKRGVIVFEVSGWGDASGHVTLLNGSSCGDSCYFVHDQPGVQTTKISFWELK